MVLWGHMHDLPTAFTGLPWTGPLIAIALPLLFALLVWSMVIKGFALWYAARNSQKKWFISLLIVNTLGILEIIYLIWFRPATTHEHPSVGHSSPAAK